MNKHGHQEHKDVLFICKERIDQYGISFGLVNSSRLVNEHLLLSGQQGHTQQDDDRINGLVVVVKDANCIDKMVHKYRPRHVILEAIWVPPYKLEQLALKWGKVTWTTRVHSKMPFLANEGIALEWLQAYKRVGEIYKNVNISGNSEIFVADIATMGISALYLPNVYPMKQELEHVVQHKHKGDTIDIGCFGALRPMKNQLLQACAAVRFADKHGFYLNFHINSHRCEQHGDQVLKNLRSYFLAVPQHHLVEHMWMPHADFIKVLNTMDLCMQVSYSETFNIVTADGVTAGVPSVVSSDIEWCPGFAKADINSSADIAKTMEFVWDLRRMGVIDVYRYLLRKHNHKATKIWHEFLKDS